MELITGNIRSLYRKYLIPSMASAIVMSIYSFVDTIAVGQAEGPAGAAAMAVINPLFGIMVFFGVLGSIGGSVLYGNARGAGDGARANALFSSAAVLMTVMTGILWALLLLFPHPLLRFFGADGELLPTVMEYARWLILFLPVFMAPIFLSAFIRNDGAPALVMAAVISGGCVNMLGDWLLVFPLELGMQGAALATVSGSAVQLIVMCTHFFSKDCTLRLLPPQGLLSSCRRIISIGFGAGSLELGIAVLSIIANNQIMAYGSTTHLAVFGVAATISALLQSLFGGVGQAIQPIVSANCGAKQNGRIRQVWRMALVTVFIMGVVLTAVCMLFPGTITTLFVDATPELLAAAPAVFRTYFPVLLCMGITVLATYHLQTTLHGGISLIIALLRGAVISGLLLWLLPLALGLTGVWLALPVAECIVAVFALLYIRTHC